MKIFKYEFCGICIIIAAITVLAIKIFKKNSVSKRKRAYFPARYQVSKNCSMNVAAVAIAAPNIPNVGIKDIFKMILVAAETKYIYNRLRLAWLRYIIISINSDSK